MKNLLLFVVSVIFLTANCVQVEKNESQEASKEPKTEIIVEEKEGDSLSGKEKDISKDEISVNSSEEESVDTLSENDIEISKDEISIDSNGPWVMLSGMYTEKFKVWNSLESVEYEEMQNDIDEGDYITFKLLAKTDSMYYVNAVFSFKEVSKKGWISRDLALEIGTRNYGGQPLDLYSSPDENSDVRTLSNCGEMYCPVIDYEGNWLKVRVELNNEVFEGWIPSENQCSNHYTNCC